MSTPRKGTQKEIARSANVSQALVSRVLSGSTIEITEETRLRILDAAESLGYTPRKRPVASRQKLFAYIHPLVERGTHQEDWIYRSYEEFFQQAHTGLLKAAYQAGYALIARPYTDAMELKHWLTHWEVDGVLWHSRNPELLRWIVERYPTVQINRHDAINADAVSSNQEESIILAMDHLRAHGHRRIAFSPMAPTNDRLWLMRTRAYEDYLERHELSAPPMLEARSDKEIHAYLRFLLDEPDNAPTALIAADHSALRLMKAAAQFRISLPERLSLVGIDNITASSLTTPPLTSIDPGMDELTRVAVATLLERITNPSAHFQKILVSPKLICRESVMDLGTGCVAKPPADPQPEPSALLRRHA